MIPEWDEIVQKFDAIDQKGDLPISDNNRLYGNYIFKGEYAHYKFEKRIGGLYMAEVNICRRLEDNHEFAIKVFTRPNLHCAHDRLKNFRSYYTEFKAFCELQDLKYVPKPIDWGEAKEGHAYFIVMELLGTSVHNYLSYRDTIRFSYRSGSIIMLEMVKCLQAIHSKGIVSGDIKLENFCFVEDLEKGGPKIKIVDFGIASSFGPEALIDLPKSTKDSIIYTNISGTPPYVSRAAYLRMKLCPYDDLESLVYACAQMFNFDLPWGRKVGIHCESTFKAKESFWRHQNSAYLGGPLQEIFNFIWTLKRSEPIPYDTLINLISTLIDSQTPFEAQGKFPAILRRHENHYYHCSIQHVPLRNLYWNSPAAWRQASQWKRYSWY